MSIQPVAFYLPQFHPIPENEAWWGAGFTEWRNVAKARPLFRGHYQPNIPRELGFYDLRVDEVREQQATLAQEAGIAAFCYYHYWFSGRLLLERPMEMLLRAGTPAFPFCVCWANHHWTRHWEGRSSEILVEQCYPGEGDDRAHYEYLRPFFMDPRYYTFNGKLLFAVFQPDDLPSPGVFIQRFRAWGREDGLPCLFFVGLSGNQSLLNNGFDAIAPHSLNRGAAKFLAGRQKWASYAMHRFAGRPRWVLPYEQVLCLMNEGGCDGERVIPTVIPNWDNSPRVGRRALVLDGSTPERFRLQLELSVRGFKKSAGYDHLLFIKSWNEWAEGNYLEPDLRWGRRYLEALKLFMSVNGGTP